MPVYNGAKYLREAIASILDQSFKDFEFLIINDGSTDNSPEIIAGYHDARIKVINQANQGLSAALNRGLELAAGEYIARMDADDISLPQRLARQVAFMDSHPEVGICGTAAIMIDEAGQELRRASYPLTHEEIKTQLLFNSTFAHPSVMFRRAVLNEHHLRYYNDKGEDYELWTRAVKVTKLANLSDFFLKYRLGVGISLNLYKNDYHRCFWQIIRRQLAELPLAVSEAEITTHRQMADYNYHPDRQFLKAMFAWLTKLKTINQSAGLYQAKILNKVIAGQWLAVCSRAPKKKLLTWPEFWFNSIKIFWRLNFFDQAALIRRVLTKL